MHHTGRGWGPSMRIKERVDRGGESEKSIVGTRRAVRGVGSKRAGTSDRSRSLGDERQREARATAIEASVAVETDSEQSQAIHASHVVESGDTKAWPSSGSRGLLA